ncbi:glutamic-type intramembrane protease PrsW [Brevibacillus humidisoli]|uniref:glutamic-type intramembrane protease PrsW n=1 Tax=Brevibacillus humidisoli TaxID=2895522 RepID=UPI001E4D2AA2|nr:glutamic-type intramembrane protease PrsW [Brevibacillus humidisoli]UFJ42811.1 glutamic-type intramembrane protease PrsW [Brevibacillus humidisoli]
MIALIGAALAPGVALLSYFYLRDNLQPEPISMVVRSFLFGVLLVFPIMMLQYVIQVEWNLTNIWFQAIVASAFIEEFFKWLIVYYTAYKHIAFDEPYDGIVYAVAVSLGFATLENFFYLITNGLEMAFWRALLPVSGHALFGIFMGYSLGLGKFTRQRSVQLKRLLTALLLPAGMHAAYNLILLSGQYWIWLITPFMLFLWWRGLKKVELAHDFGSKTRNTRPD